MRVIEYQRMFECENTLWWYVGLRDFIQYICKTISPQCATLSILDVGCGTGANLDFLKTFGRTAGLDVSPAALEFCKARGLQDLTRASALQLPYKSDLFDLVICMDVLGHSAIVSDVLALKEIQRVLKPGGRVLLQVAALDCLRGPHDEAILFNRRYSHKSLKLAVESAGFRIRRLTYRYLSTFPALLAHRQIGRFFKQKDEIPDSDVSVPRPIINSALTRLILVENSITRYINVPVGSSLFCYAEKVA